MAKNKDKELLLRDLSARLFYGVKVLIPELRQDTGLLVGVNNNYLEVQFEQSKIYCPLEIQCVPYLRPMSSMTAVEWKEYRDITCCLIEGCESWNEVDWLNAHHFDYRGLIERGLALEASEGMYNLKDE